MHGIHIEMPHILRGYRGYTGGLAGILNRLASAPAGAYERYRPTQEAHVVLPPSILSFTDHQRPHPCRVWSSLASAHAQPECIAGIPVARDG